MKAYLKYLEKNANGHSYSIFLPIPTYLEYHLKQEIGKYFVEYGFTLFAEN